MENLEKLIELIGKLPVDRVKIVIDKCQSFVDISPKVLKLQGLFEKLSPEEQEQFLHQVNKPVDGDDWTNPSDGEWALGESDIGE